MYSAQSMWLNANETRKVTRGNIASLYASLLHLINVSSVGYASNLISFSGIVYSRIVAQFDISAIELIRELKLVRRWYLEYIRNGKLSNPGLESYRWDNVHGTPVLLAGIDEVFNNIHSNKLWDPYFLYQILFTLLSIDRIIAVPVTPNHSTITNASLAKLDLLPSDEEIKAALNSLNITPADFKAIYKEQVQNFTFEVLSTKGPNGDATWSAHLDARAWLSNLPLAIKFKAFLEESNLISILNAIVGVIPSPAHDAIPNSSPILGKLAYLEEWGNKSRIVAQLDYWTQMALTPLHNTINHFLKALVTDGTFNQHAIADRVRGWTVSDANLDVYSYDLTAATDRLPISFQIKILNYLMSSSAFASNWASILVEREFLTNNGEMITYNTGQPMGARSSFPMLALTHHIIIQIAAARAEVDNYMSYAVLGDDSTITGSGVSTQYLTLMDILGVPINLTKSIVHVVGATPVAEICKRVFMDGIEISRYNPKLIVNTIRDGRLGPDLQNDLFIRGFNFSSSVFWQFMAGLLNADNLTTLLKLNLAPISITGLLHQYVPDGTNLTNYNNWVPGRTDINAQNLVELFTYICASEALKRLDALLRATIDINNTLQTLAVSNDYPQGVHQFTRDNWLSSYLSPEDLIKFGELIGDPNSINPSHPIVLASQAEANRISELLHSLNSLDTTIVARARLGLLDIFRTSVSSIWLDSSNTPMGESRALFHKFLTTFANLLTSPLPSGTTERNLSLSYSVVLSTLGRLWTVSIQWGGACSINALRSTITRNINKASTTLDGSLKGLSFSVPAFTSTTASPPISARSERRRRWIRSQSPKISPL